jgi:hypothetical protein
MLAKSSLRNLYDSSKISNMLNNGSNRFGWVVNSITQRVWKSRCFNEKVTNCSRIMLHHSHGRSSVCQN